MVRIQISLNLIGASVPLLCPDLIITALSEMKL